MKKCKIEECPLESYVKGHCSKHYMRLRRTGSIERSRRIKLVVERLGDLAYIQLTDGDWTVIDCDDIKLVRNHLWYKASGYATVRINNQVKLMHQLILPNTKMIDHINRDKLDNRRKNLRSTNPYANGLNQGLRKSNTSGFTGVHQTAAGKWQARIRLEGKRIYLGSFNTPEEASTVYNEQLETFFKEERKN